MNIRQRTILVTVPPRSPAFARTVAESHGLPIFDRDLDSAKSARDGAEALARSGYDFVIRTRGLGGLPLGTRTVLLPAPIDPTLIDASRSAGLLVLQETEEMPLDPSVADGWVVRASNDSNCLPVVARLCAATDRPVWGFGGLDRRTLAGLKVARATGGVLRDSLWPLDIELSRDMRDSLLSARPGETVMIKERECRVGSDIVLAAFASLRALDLHSGVELARHDFERGSRLFPSEARVEPEFDGNALRALGRSEPRQWLTTPGRNAVAIVGYGCVLPGAPNADRFRDLLVRGASAVCPVPDGRWGSKPEAFLNSGTGATGGAATSIGGWVREVPPFQLGVFGIGESEAAQLDDVQRWALLAVLEALEDGGFAYRHDDRILLSGMDRERSGVVIGTTMGGEQKGKTAARVTMSPFIRGFQQGTTWGSLSGELRSRLTAEIEAVFEDAPELDESTLTGSLPNLAAGRIAGVLDLGGLNCTLDAACSASLAALQFAMNALRDGSHDVMLWGGVDQTMDPMAFAAFTALKALSPERCSPYDAQADGIVMGEGASMFVLKSLDHAIRDGNKIHAVIRGIGCSSDGKSTGVTAPVGSRQELAIRRAYEDAELEPERVDYIEGHGTGTKVGDPVELGALASCFRTSDEDRSVVLGSVKGQIGHLKCAAGAAAVLKVCHSLKERTFFATGNFARRTSAFNWDDSPLRVLEKAEAWPTPPHGEPRRAGVSAFGFGGANFHVVMEEYVAAYHERSLLRTRRGRTGNLLGSKTELGLFSASTSGDLVAKISAVIDDLREHRTTVTDFCRHGREASSALDPHRVAVVLPTSYVEAIGALRTAIDGLRPKSEPIGVETGSGLR